MINKILANRYEILEKIGTGGMGNVFKAHDRKLDRIVAIKVLKLEYNEDNNFIRKFKRESLAAASISHPNIVSIYDVGTEKIDDKEVHYIVMEYIDGKTLKDLINDEGRLSEKRALNYCIQIAEALKVAHSKHIVHRDIKSQNIMVTRDDRIKVTDFGIARVADNTTVTATNAVMGSVHYFSPEQARGAKVDNRSDIYSLGIVLFEMLTGRLPFDADNPVSVALMQVQSQMPKPSDYIKSIDPSVDGFEIEDTNFKNAINILNPRGIIDTKYFENGEFYVQDLGSILVSTFLNPSKDSKVLDLCAAPGGKSTHLAEIMENTGEIVACDKSKKKIKLIEENARRLGVKNIKTFVNDAEILNKDFLDKFDYVLVDAPCSGTGLYRKKPDIKWNKDIKDLKNLSEIQIKILENAKNYLKLGGHLVYSTCSLSKIENEDVVYKFLEENENFKIKKLRNKEVLKLFPSVDDTDGFSIVLLEKIGL